MKISFSWFENITVQKKMVEIILYFTNDLTYMIDRINTQQLIVFIGQTSFPSYKGGPHLPVFFFMKTSSTSYNL